MTVRAVIFDLGHTLWDIRPLEDGALDEAYAAAHADLRQRLPGQELPPPAKLRQAVSDVLHESAETYLTGSAQLEQPPTHFFVDQAWRRLGLTLPEEVLRLITPQLFARERLQSDGARETLARLRDSGYALGCVTNTLASAAVIADALAGAGLLELMGSVVVSSEEGWRKPHPALFRKALNALGAEPQRAVFVGDSPWHDIAGAKAVGMRAVLTRQYATRSVDAGLPAPDAVIEHIRDLPDVIARLRRLSAADRPRPSPAG